MAEGSPKDFAKELAIGAGLRIYSEAEVLAYDALVGPPLSNTAKRFKHAGKEVADRLYGVSLLGWAAFRGFNYSPPNMAKMAADQAGIGAVAVIGLVPGVVRGAERLQARRNYKPVMTAQAPAQPPDMDFAAREQELLGSAEDRQPVEEEQTRQLKDELQIQQWVGRMTDDRPKIPSV